MLPWELWLGRRWWRDRGRRGELLCYRGRLSKLCSVLQQKTLPPKVYLKYLENNEQMFSKVCKMCLLENNVFTRTSLLVAYELTFLFMFVDFAITCHYVVLDQCAPCYLLFSAIDSQFMQNQACYLSTQKIFLLCHLNLF